MQVFIYSGAVVLQRRTCLTVVARVSFVPHTQCLYLLSGAQHEDQSIEMLIELYNALEQCRFEDVWVIHAKCHARPRCCVCYLTYDALLSVC